MKQTAVDYLEERRQCDYITWEDIQQAKEMEKQQIVNAFVDGRNVGSKDHPGVDGNYYYEQVYK
jgi:hypothetical protein